MGLVRLDSNYYWWYYRTVITIFNYNIAVKYVLNLN